MDTFGQNKPNFGNYVFWKLINNCGYIVDFTRNIKFYF